MTGDTYVLLGAIAASVSLLTAVISAYKDRGVRSSEASLRAKFDSGQYTPESRALMRQAGYNV